jgi:hypothetical protein
MGLKKFQPMEVVKLGGCRILHNEKLDNVKLSIDIIRVIRSRWKRWQVIQHSSHMLEIHSEIQAKMRRSRDDNIGGIGLNCSVSG